jgi:hypothetical protein
MWKWQAWVCECDRIPCLPSRTQASSLANAYTKSLIKRYANGQHSENIFPGWSGIIIFPTHHPGSIDKYVTSLFSTNSEKKFLYLKFSTIQLRTNIWVLRLINSILVMSSVIWSFQVGMMYCDTGVCHLVLLRGIPYVARVCRYTGLRFPILDPIIHKTWLPSIHVLTQHW